MEKLLTDLKIEEKSSQDITQDISQIVEQSRRIAYATVDVVLLQRNWLIGKRIYEEILNNPRKENYGKVLVRRLSKELTSKFGSGFSVINLYYYQKFYTLYKNIFYSVSKQSLLSWTHYRISISIDNKKERDWYEKEAIESGWSVRTLQRNINTQYYQRLLSSQIKEPVIKEMEEKTSEYQNQKLEHIKNPMIFEFFGVKGNEQLFATKYKLYLPSEIELKAEIEHQKELFYLSLENKNA